MKNMGQVFLTVLRNISTPEGIIREGEMVNKSVFIVLFIDC